MSDLAQALAHGVRAYWTDSVHVDGEAWQAVAAAARRVAEAPEVWWCIVHDEYAGKTAPSHWSHQCFSSDALHDPTPCRMVRKLLVDPPEQA